MFETGNVQTIFYWQKYKMSLKILMTGVNKTRPWSSMLVTSDSPNQDLFHGFVFVKTRQSLWFMYSIMHAVYATIV